MFSNSNFNQDLSNWNLSNIKNVRHLFFKSKFNKNMFNLKKIIKKEEIYSKNINFIKNNINLEF